MQDQIEFTDPKICNHSNDLLKSWFIYFEVYNLVTLQTIRKQFRGGINYFPTVKGRTRAAKTLANVWREKLKRGWSPFYNAAPQLNRMNINEALTFALGKCSVSISTRRCYKTTVTFIKEASEELGMQYQPIIQVKRQHIKLLLEECKKKWTNSGFNKHAGYLSAVFEQLVDWQIIEYNPAKKIKTLPVAETRKYVPLTGPEKDRLREYLFIHHYRFFVYLMVLYHTGIRPKEILMLKIKDIDLSRQIITIMPIIEAENSKTKTIRYVPISNQLLPFLRELQLHNYDQYYYIFGSPYEPGRGNKGSAAGKLTGAMHPDYFKPSLTKIKRDTVTRLWNTVVKGKLKIDKYQYALKHTGCDDKLLAGIDLDSLKELYGHASKYMTEKYASVLMQLHFKKVQENSPAF